MLIRDQDGHDVLEGVGLNRDLAATERVSIVFSGTAVHPHVDERDTLTLRVENNSVASAQVAIRLVFAPGA